VPCWKLQLPPVELQRYEHSGRKGSLHTILKEIHAKATVIALASFDVGRFNKSLEDEEDEEDEEER